MRPLCLLALVAASASAQNLVFTTRVHLDCPVQMSAIAQTKDAGFDSAMLRNESKKTVDTVTLYVALISESGEEIVEKASVLVMLGAGQGKRVNLGLGHVQDLSNKARNSHRRVVQATLFVESVEFADGSQWSADEPAINDPVRRPPSK